MVDTEFTPQAEQPRTMPWAAIGFGVALVAVLFGVLWLLARDSHGGESAGPDPYAASLQLSDSHMSVAQNFVGATVIYLDGTAANRGDKTVTRATVRAEFKDSMGQVVLRAEPPLMMTAERPGYSDTVDLSQSPLRAGQSRPFRLTFEGVPSAWNQQPPELKVTRVTTQ